MHRRRSDYMKARRGFSMIEMLMGVVLISLAVMWALPRFSIARYRADAAGRRVRSLLQTGQRNAITRQSNVIISFASTLPRLRLPQDVHHNSAITPGELVH